MSVVPTEKKGNILYTCFGSPAEFIGCVRAFFSLDIDMFMFQVGQGQQNPISQRYVHVCLVRMNPMVK